MAIKAPVEVWKSRQDSGKVVTMVAENAWKNWMATICKPFTMSTIKCFNAGEEQAARDRLSAAKKSRFTEKT